MYTCVVWGHPPIDTANKCIQHLNKYKHFDHHFQLTLLLALQYQVTPINSMMDHLLWKVTFEIAKS